MAETFIWHGLRQRRADLVADVRRGAPGSSRRSRWRSASSSSTLPIDFAVLAEEQAAVRVEHDALGLERARREPVVAVGDHVGVVHVDVVLPVEQRIHAHAIEEELAHALLLGADRLADLRPEVGVAEHRLGEPHHVEDDVELLPARPGEDVLGVVEVAWRRSSVEMPKLNGTRFCSSCIAGIVSPRLLEPVLHVAAPCRACRRRRRSTRAC